MISSRHPGKAFSMPDERIDAQPFDPQAVFKEVDLAVAAIAVLRPAPAIGG